jgi:predicted DNA-binding transcriptional regulator YafY
MKDPDTKRLSRLAAILTQLQTRKLLTSTSLAEKHSVSVRTIYRDIRALEKAGIPILTEDGKGYTLLEGYRIPPIMFTENEANALVTAEHLVLQNKDSSLIKEYTEAINKIRAVLLYATREKVELLSTRIAISPNLPDINRSSSLTLIQSALTSFKVLNIVYQSEHNTEKTNRNIEPFALYYSIAELWVLIAYCQLRKDFRMFRLDRILGIVTLEQHFTPHKMTLQEYLKNKENNYKHP